MGEELIRLSDIISFYNITKVWIDLLDQASADYKGKEDEQGDGFRQYDFE